MAHPTSPNTNSRLWPACRTLGLALVFAGSGLASSAYAGFVATTTKNPAPNTLYYRLNQPLVAGDASKLQAMLSAKTATPGKTTVWVHFNSKGGDLQEAFRVGRLLRKYNAYTTHGQCVGACVYAFMGGAMRYYTPHRPQMEMDPSPPDMTGLWVYEPYVMAKVLPMAPANPIIAKALKEVKDYTVEMTGKTAFYDSVIKIPHAKPIRMGRNNVFDMNVGSLQASGSNTKQAMPTGEKPPAW